MSKTISQEEVKRIAHLARIQLSTDELIKFQEQLSSVVEYANVLAEVDVSGVESTARTTSLHNIWRDDEPTGSLPMEAALSQAGSRQNNMFKVRKVLGEG